MNIYRLTYWASFVLFLFSLSGLLGCGKKCKPQWYDSLTFKNECTQEPSSYAVYISSGFPLASGTGLITRWTQEGIFNGIIYDYARIANNVMPQGMTTQTINGRPRLVTLGFDGTNGRVDSLNVDGSDFTPFFTNAGLTAGTKRISATSSGGYLVTRTAGVEFFNSSKQRIGSPLFSTSGTCTLTLGTGSTEVLVDGVNYVVTSNAAATPNNKLNLHNGSTGTCITGGAPTGPSTTMWPVDLEYAPSEEKLFVLYYPFTGSVTNAQIWQFEVTAGGITNGTLVYNDMGADIATISATPATLSSAITFFKTGNEKYIFVGTANSSVIKFSYDDNVLTKVGTTPFIYQASYGRSISDVLVLSQ